jgi:hypothetical protein
LWLRLTGSKEKAAHADFFTYLRPACKETHVPQNRLIIEGTREDGSQLRPLDWIERISSVLATFGADHRLTYANCVKPCFIDGQKCLVVARCLAGRNPQAYEFIMNFAKSNQLRIQVDRREGSRALVCGD